MYAKIAENRDARRVHAGRRDRLVLQHEHRRRAPARRRPARPRRSGSQRIGSSSGAEPMCASVRHMSTKFSMPSSMPAQHTANAGVPAPVVLDPRRREHRHGRADVDRHVVDRERAVDARVVAFVDAAHEVRGVRLEEAVADDDHAERRIQEVELCRSAPPASDSRPRERARRSIIVRRAPSTLSPIQPPIDGDA